MRDTRFATVGEQLLNAGVAPRHARRAVFELTGHFEDLVAELQSTGVVREDAEAEATARLNPDALIAAAIARPELHSWVRRWPLASCTVFPLVLYMAFVVGSIALVVGGVTVFEQDLGMKLASSRELQWFATTCLSGVAWAVPIFVAGMFCSIAQSRRTPLAWTIIGAMLVSLVGATLNAGVLLPPNDRPGLQAGFGFSTEAFVQPLLRAALTLAIVLPIYFWRRAISLDRVRAPAASRVIAIGAVLVLHVAMLALLMSGRVPRLDSYIDDTAMTLIVLPPAASPRVVVPERTTPVPARARESGAAPSAIPTETTPPIEERAPIDWTREAELAANHQVDAVEIERRRARGFTPGAQSREPEVARTPAPDFAWSKAATQPIEQLPEGGTLIRLNDRCVIVIYVIPMPFCGIGEIPANGDLFEHMNDPPVIGDWKDDSALPR
jgi:hypothetical protein